MKNSERLEADIREGLTKYKAMQFEPNQYGTVAYQVVMELGIDKKKEILTAWQIDKGSTRPRLITAYEYKKGKSK